MSDYQPIKDCPMRHENGNCLTIGGFCMSVSKVVCDAARSGYASGYGDGCAFALPSIPDRELDEIEARYNAATPGPWTADDYGDMIWAADPYGHGLMRVLDIRGWGHLTGVGACRFPEEKAIAIQRANRAFAAHSRTDIPRLVTEVRQLRAELQEAEPVRHGRWVPNSPFTGNCSECGGDGNLKQRNCGDCGAKMDATREG